METRGTAGYIILILRYSLESLEESHINLMCTTYGMMVLEMVGGRMNNNVVRCK